MISITNNSSSTTQKLQAFLSGAAATTNPTVTVVSYIVPPQSKPDYSEYRRASQYTVLAGATETDIADAPPSGSVKDIIYVSIYNADTAAVTVTVCIDDNSTNRLQCKVTLGVASTLYYESEHGWYVVDANGALITSLGPTGQFTNLTVTGNTVLGDAASDTVVINAESVSQPNIPSFLAYNSASDTNQTGAGAVANVQFDTEVFDQSGDFASNTFTAPATGKYLLSTSVRYSSIPAGSTTFLLSLVTSNRTYSHNIVAVAGTFTQGTQNITAIADMDSGDTASVTLQISGGAGDTAAITGGANAITFFSGERIA